MNFLDKYTFLNIFKDDIYYGVSKRKKQISCRVYVDFYDFIVKHYDGTFADFLDRVMRDYVQQHAEQFVKDRYNK